VSHLAAVDVLYRRFSEEEVDVVVDVVRRHEVWICEQYTSSGPANNRDGLRPSSRLSFIMQVNHNHNYNQSHLFHRRTRNAYLYNVCLAWYNVVLTARSLKREIQTTSAKC